MPVWKRSQNALRSAAMIVSRQNAKLKTIRRLRKSKGDEALLEGPHLVAEALASLVAPEVLASVMDADTPQGALAVAPLPRSGVASLPHRRDGIYVYLDGVQDPGNLGAIARVAEAAGTAGLACGPGTAHPNPPRPLRASAGSLLRLPVAVGARPEALRDH